MERCAVVTETGGDQWRKEGGVMGRQKKQAAKERRAHRRKVEARRERFAEKFGMSEAEFERMAIAGQYEMERFEERVEALYEQEPEPGDRAMETEGQVMRPLQVANLYRANKRDMRRTELERVLAADGGKYRYAPSSVIAKLLERDVPELGPWTSAWVRRARPRSAGPWGDPWLLARKRARDEREDEAAGRGSNVVEGDFGSGGES